MFTALIPLQLSMLQTDSMTSQSIQESKFMDTEKDLENLNLVAYPTTTTSDQLKIRVENRGSISVNLVKLWIKDQYFQLNNSIGIGDVTVLGPFTVNLIANTSYPVKAVTDRGNIFSSNAGNMIYTTQGIWFTPSLGINVYIANDKGKYYIQVSNSTWSDEYETEGQDFGDVVVLFDVNTIDTYHVICKKNGPSGPNLPGTPVDVEITWPDGSPIVFVYTSGLDT